jgi:hypothetical protein
MLNISTIVSNNMPARRYFLWFKYGVYNLLALNIYLFFRHTTFHEGLDCLGWFLLLIVFEYETNPQLQARLPSIMRWLATPLQLLSILCILYAIIRYYTQEQWLDLGNGILWLLVLASLELDIYVNASQAKTNSQLHNTLKTLLYAALVAVAVAWGITGDLLNFYDAMLWVSCFFFIELNLLGLASTQ